MSQYDMSGILFKNDRKMENEKAPDYTGKMEVNGQEYRLAAWVKQGQKGKFMSLKLSPPYNQERKSQSVGDAAQDVARQMGAPLDDDVPF